MRLCYNNVELSTDAMHLNDVPFLISVSHDFRCGTAGAVDNLKCHILESELSNVVRCYRVREFNVVLITVDIQFKSLKDRNKIGVKFNVVSKGEHAPIIERFHRLIEEQCRCYYAMLLFEYLPRQMVVGLMTTVMFYVNAFA